MRDTRHDLNQETADAAAAAWVLRLDAGLTPAEEEQLTEWLAEDPRHAAALAESQGAWNRFEPVTAELAARLPVPQRRPSSARRLRWFAPALAAAAAIAFGLFVWRRDAPAPAVAAASMPVAALPPPCEERTLEDGSVITCNRGGDVVAVYTSTERRVELRRGEAHFSVTKDATRPFIVSVGGVQVRAVGTAFDVKLEASAVDVLVTEGKVRIDSPLAAAPAADATSARNGVPKVATIEAPTLSAGQNLVLPLVAPAARPAQVKTLSAAEIGAKLAWQPRILSYDDVPLSEIVAEFNRCNPVRLVVAGASLRSLRLTASFRSDNVQGFVRLLSANYGVSAEPRERGEIELRRK